LATGKASARRASRVLAGNAAAGKTRVVTSNAGAGKSRPVVQSSGRGVSTRRAAVDQIVEQAAPKRSFSVRKAAAKAAMAASKKTGRAVDDRVKKLAES
jgi:hypothetical protein